jgi:2-polyprenyl-3-methyl-5-hydroxy-6-metoxy-1,4-benzoquinol methylase
MALPNIEIPVLKSVANRVVRMLGYQVAKITPDAFPLNPRIDVNDWRKSLEVIRRATVESDDSMSWERSRRYLQLRRVNFYYGVLEELERADLLQPGAQVLDIGVYFGYMIRILQTNHPDLSCYGTETHDRRLAIARELCPNATLWRGTIDELDHGRRYDLVLLTEVLEHLVDPGRAVKKLLQHTDNLMLSVPNGRLDNTPAMAFHPEWASYRGHINFWGPESWQYWLERELPSHHITTGVLPSHKLYAIIRKPPTT